MSIVPVDSSYFNKYSTNYAFEKSLVHDAVQVFVPCDITIETHNSVNATNNMYSCKNFCIILFKKYIEVLHITSTFTEWLKSLKSENYFI